MAPSRSERQPAQVKRRQRRYDWKVASALAVVVLTAAIVARVLDDPTLRIAIHQGVEGVALRALAREFSRTHDVSVELFELPYGALYDAELRAVSADRPDFDVVMVDDPWLPALIGEDENGESTRVERLEFNPQECDRLALTDFVDTTLQVSVHPAPEAASGQGAPITTGRSRQCGTRIDGLYALPIVGNSQLFLVHRDVEPTPETWAEVEAVGRPPAVRAVADTPAIANAGYVARVGPGNSIVTDFMSILWTVPGRLQDHPESLAALRPASASHFRLDWEQSRPAFDYLKRLGGDQRANRAVISTDDFDLAIHLINDKASMMIAWSAWVMALAKLPEPYNAQLLDLDSGEQTDVGEKAAFKVTQVPGGAPVLGAWLLAIPARSPNKDMAREFLLWTTDKERMVTAARSGNPPVRRSTFAALNDEYPFYATMLASLESAQARPRTPFWRTIETVLGECLTTLYEGGVESEEAWARVDQGLEMLRRKQDEIDAARRRYGSPDAADARRQAIRAILDEPIPPFSCAAPS